MKDGLNFIERREEILLYLTVRKKTTRFELASEFGVSLDTIDRDITYLSSIAPIYTKQGNGGGIYILPEFRSYKNYLTDTEENLLYDMMLKVSNEEKESSAVSLPSLQKPYAFFILLSKSKQTGGSK